MEHKRLVVYNTVLLILFSNLSLLSDLVTGYRNASPQKSLLTWCFIMQSNLQFEMLPDRDYMIFQLGNECSAFLCGFIIRVSVELILLKIV